MKKIFTLIMFAALTAGSAMAQNMVSNPTFSLNDEGYIDGWYVYDGEAVAAQGPNNEAAIEVNATKTTKVQQYINDVEPMKDYVISFDYKVVSATANTCRFWGRWQRYVSSSDKDWVDPSEKDKENMQMSGYLDMNNNEWKHISFTVTAHDASINTLEYGFRTYGGADVIWANPYFAPADGTGLTDANAAKTGIYAYDGTVVVLANESGVAEVYNLLGEKVKSVMVEEGSNEISDLARGQVYVVRYGNKVQKVIL